MISWRLCAIVTAAVLAWATAAEAECCLTGRTWHDSPAVVNVPGMEPSGCRVIEVWSDCMIEEWDWECQHPCLACLDCRNYGAYIILARTPLVNKDSFHWSPVYTEACPEVDYCWIVEGMVDVGLETICRCPNG